MIKRTTKVARVTDYTELSPIIHAYTERYPQFYFEGSNVVGYEGNEMVVELRFFRIS